MDELSRRSFLSRVGLSGLALGARTLSSGARAEPASPAPAEAPAAAGRVAITLRVNGRAQALEVEPREILLDVLRERLHLFGTKKGCDHGQCGACTVLADGRRIDSCLALAAAYDGAELTTIEGLEQDGRLHPMQAAFLDCDGFQCGACTSGQIMSAVALLHEPVGGADRWVREAMSGNLCRCGAYQNIVAAVQRVRHGGV